MKTLFRRGGFALATVLCTALWQPHTSQAQKCVCPAGTELVAKYNSEDPGGEPPMFVFVFEKFRDIATFDNYDRDEDGEILGFDWVTTETVTVLVLKAGSTVCDEEGGGTSGTVSRSGPPAISHVDFCVSPTDPCATNMPPTCSGCPNGGSVGGTMTSVTFNDTEGDIQKITLQILDNIIVEFGGTDYGPGSVLNFSPGESSVSLIFKQANSGVSSAFYSIVVNDGCTNTDFDPVLEWNVTPSAFVLEDNYPNPFNPSTTIRFRVAEAGPVNLKVYDVLGREVQSLINRRLEPGSYEVEWDGTNAEGAPVASGMYLYQMEAGGFAASKTMLLAK